MHPKIAAIVLAVAVGVGTVSCDSTPAPKASPSAGTTATQSPKSKIVALQRTATGPVDRSFVRPRNEHPDKVAKAYTQSVKAGTAAVNVVLSRNGKPLAEGRGVVDFEARRSRLVMQDVRAPRALSEILDVNGVLYQRGVDTADPAALRKVGWIALSVAEVLQDEAAGAVPLAIMPPESIQFLGRMHAALRAAMVPWPGRAACNGHTAEVDPKGATFKTGTKIGVGACFDSRGRLSRVVYSYLDGKKPASALIEFTEYGRPVAVEPPTKSVGTL